MELHDLAADIYFDVWMAPAPGEKDLIQGFGELISAEEDATFTLRIEEKRYRAVLLDSVGASDIFFHIRQGFRASLVFVRGKTSNGSHPVRIAFFAGPLLNLGDIEIGIDDTISKSAKSVGLGADLKTIAASLHSKCCFGVNGVPHCCLMPAHSAEKEDFSSDSDDLRGFVVHGSGLRLSVEKRCLGNTQFFMASRLVHGKSPSNKGGLRLAKVNVNFTDIDQTKKISAYVAEAMSNLLANSGSYLKKWDEYGSIEGTLLLNKAKSIGFIPIRNLEPAGDTSTRFYVENIPEQLKEEDCLCLTRQMPSYLKNKDMTWEDYSKELEEEFKKASNASSKDKPFREQGVVLSLSPKCIEVSIPYASIETNDLFLTFDIEGDKAQIERRSQARSDILKGQSANPQLGLLIEAGENAPLSLGKHGQPIPPLTEFVRQKVFRHAPTLSQEKAIKIALNTPDIALIQGPPGTGKTTVITAILERLNELNDKTNSIAGQVLVSGFQHDAVENLISRLSVNSLPAVKFGRRSGEAETSHISEKMIRWCADTAASIRDTHPEMRHTEEQVRLNELFRTYAICPSKSNAITLIRRILELPSTDLTPEIRMAAIDILETLSPKEHEKESVLLHAVRALRTSEASFRDDGKMRAINLFVVLEDMEWLERLSEDERELLDFACRWRQSKPLEFLPKLRELKGKLMDMATPVPQFTVEKVRNDILELIARTTKSLETSRRPSDKKMEAVAEFLHELENNEDGVREALEAYNFVYAATVQQALGRDILNTKKRALTDSNARQKVKYDTVIVDEAARCSPRDLLIPMSLAEKRIILVGDHRQLPHIINEDVVRVLMEGDPSPEDDLLKHSMFQYMFDRLKKLEEKDGICRTVTLDAQFRTHPLLGDFVSQFFYTPYGEGYSSPLPAALFDHALPGIEHLPAVWVDVPSSEGTEIRLSSGSRKREPEAVAIARLLKGWMDSEAGKGLSFGVISFYKAQVVTVFEALQDCGLTEKDSGGKWCICQEYRSLPDGSERLRIGTVDSFQGMEFDIVLLSMVRSPKYTPSMNTESRGKQLNGIFGHLTSKNRLCVSMSRQKKALIIVGDGTLAASEMAAEAVPALHAFHHLCFTEGKVL
ncbi:DEAD/DEAH box helicase [Mailhella sp.]